MYKTISTYLFALVLACFAIGCDSGGSTSEVDPEPTDSELFLGTWVVTDLSDDTGSQQAALQQNFDLVEAMFDADGTYVMTVDAKDDAQDATIEGPYSVNELANQLTLTILFSGQELPVAFGYVFENDNTVVLSANSALINPLFGTTLQGSVALTLTKQ